MTMTHEQVARLCAELATSQTVDVANSDRDALVDACTRVVDAWPGCTFHVYPDRIDGKYVATLRSRVAVGSDH